MESSPRPPVSPPTGRVRAGQARPWTAPRHQPPQASVDSPAQGVRGAIPALTRRGLAGWLAIVAVLLVLAAPAGAGPVRLLCTIAALAGLVRIHLGFDPSVLVGTSTPLPTTARDPSSQESP